MTADYPPSSMISADDGTDSGTRNSGLVLSWDPGRRDWSGSAARSTGVGSDLTIGPAGPAGVVWVREQGLAFSQCFLTGRMEQLCVPAASDLTVRQRALLGLITADDWSPDLLDHVLSEQMSVPIRPVADRIELFMWSRLVDQYGDGPNNPDELLESVAGKRSNADIDLLVPRLGAYHALESAALTLDLHLMAPQWMNADVAQHNVSTAIAIVERNPRALAVDDLAMTDSDRVELEDRLSLTFTSLEQGIFAFESDAPELSGQFRKLADDLRAVWGDALDRRRPDALAGHDLLAYRGATAVMERVAVRAPTVVPDNVDALGTVYSNGTVGRPAFADWTADPAPRITLSNPTERGWHRFVIATDDALSASDLWVLCYGPVARGEETILVGGAPVTRDGAAGTLQASVATSGGVSHVWIGSRPVVTIDPLSGEPLHRNMLQAVDDARLAARVATGTQRIAADYWVSSAVAWLDAGMLTRAAWATSMYDVALAEVAFDEDSAEMSGRTMPDWFDGDGHSSADIAELVLQAIRDVEPSLVEDPPLGTAPIWWKLAALA